MRDLTINEIKGFFKERPLISVSGISKESGFSGRLLSLILDENKPHQLTDNVKEKLLPVMEKYGYKEVAM